MALEFLPSLKHIAAVKVALAVYSKDINYFFDEFLKINKEFSDFMDEGEIIRERKKEISKCLSTLLPEPLVDLILQIHHPIHAEVYFWVRDHFYIVKRIEKSYNMKSLCWKSEGTIDRTKTAELLVRNENIDKRIRFALACIYFWEHEVLHLWKSMTEDEKQNIPEIDFNVATIFWMNWLRKDAIFSWHQCVQEYITQNLLSENTRKRGRDDRSNRMRLSSFFIESSSVIKRFCLHSLWPNNCHVDDLRLCYKLTDATGRDENFHSDSIIVQVLCCYLEWPLQSLFFDALKQLWNHLTLDCFVGLVKYILYRKLWHTVEDFDYLPIFKKLWNQIPDYCKQEIQKSYYFRFIQAALDYDAEKTSLSLKEILGVDHIYMKIVIR